MYVVDLWGVVYKIDVRSGDTGRIVWRMDPKQEKPPQSNRGAALWGDYVISSANYPPRIIATDRDTGKVAWETNLSDEQSDVEITAAPLAVKDKIIVGAANGDAGVRDFIAGLDAKTGKLLWRKYVIPAPGEPGSETWKDNHNAWQTGGGAMWVTGTYDVASNQVIWGTGNPVPMFDATYRPGDNLYTDSVISWNPDSGKMNWYPLWKINVGVGFAAPPMTFSVNGKQYVAILSGLSRVAMGKNTNSPELKEQRNQMMLFVFGL